MIPIRFIAPAGVFDFDQLDPDTREPGLYIDKAKVLRSLDGLAYTDEAFADYLADGEHTRALAGVGIVGGHLKFEFDEASQKLLAVTEYASPRTLVESEVAALKAYTIGQWSDGIGSNFFQERMSVGLAPQVLIVDEAQVRVEQA